VTFHPAFTGTGITLIVPPLRYAPAVALPPYSYGHGHDLPPPVNDPAGHLFTGQHTDSLGQWQFRNDLRADERLVNRVSPVFGLETAALGTPAFSCGLGFSGGRTRRDPALTPEKRHSGRGGGRRAIPEPISKPGAGPGRRKQPVHESLIRRAMLVEVPLAGLPLST